ncbi:MAG: TetR/AcrR family transcriptional regulator [Pseudomonadota bacterium]
MPRRALTHEEIDSYRLSYCETAFDLYKKNDYAGVTMRAIAKEMGISPMTAYRYFDDKEEVFAALRAMHFDRLADTLEAVNKSLPPREYLRELAVAYAGYANKEPHGYRLLYVVHIHQMKAYPEMESAQLRTQQLLFNATRRAIQSGEIQGEPAVLAHTLWASIHGLVSLHLANQLTRGSSFKELFTAMLDQLLSA